MHKVCVGGVVLAGGASRRMGRDKALIELNGKPLIEHCVTALQTVASKIVVVAADETAYSVPGAETIADLYPGEGPVGGICTGLERLGEGLHIVVGCDMPELQPALLKLLVNSWSPEYEAVTVAMDGQLQPLCAAYGYDCLPSLNEYLANGGRSARGALQRLNVLTLETDKVHQADPNLLSFRNINTDEDLAAFVLDTAIDE